MYEMLHGCELQRQLLRMPAGVAVPTVRCATDCARRGGSSNQTLPENGTFAGSRLGGIPGDFAFRGSPCGRGPPMRKLVSGSGIGSTPGDFA